MSEAGRRRRGQRRLAVHLARVRKWGVELAPMVLYLEAGEILALDAGDAVVVESSVPAEPGEWVKIYLQSPDAEPEALAGLAEVQTRRFADDVDVWALALRRPPSLEELAGW